MRRPLIILLSMLFLFGAQSAQAATVGISDQQASTFTNPLYKPLNLKLARYIAPYDVVSDPFQLQRFVAWYGAAIMAKQRMLVSFEHSRTKGKEQKAPSLSLIHI